VRTTGVSWRAKNSIYEIPFSFIDVETTGLSHQNGDRVCELAVLRCRLGKRGRLFHTLINPLCPVSCGAMRVNGITNEMLHDAPIFETIADDFLSFISNSVIVVHNAPFDINFLKMEMGRIGKFFPQNHIIDTLYLSRRYYSFRSNSLPNLAWELGIKSDKFHRALADVHTTRKVFESFLEDFQMKGLSTIEELLRL